MDIYIKISYKMAVKFNQINKKKKPCSSKNHTQAEKNKMTRKKTYKNKI